MSERIVMHSELEIGDEVEIMICFKVLTQNSFECAEKGNHEISQGFGASAKIQSRFLQNRSRNMINYIFSFKFDNNHIYNYSLHVSAFFIWPSSEVSSFILILTLCTCPLLCHLGYITRTSTNSNVYEN
jgi:hypothetical protein